MLTPFLSFPPSDAKGDVLRYHKQKKLFDSKFHVPYALDYMMSASFKMLSRLTPNQRLGEFSKRYRVRSLVSGEQSILEEHVATA